MIIGFRLAGIALGLGLAAWALWQELHGQDGTRWAVLAALAVISGAALG